MMLMLNYEDVLMAIIGHAYYGSMIGILSKEKYSRVWHSNKIARSVPAMGVE